MKDLKLGKDFKVTLHNDLIEARFKTTYSPIELKILYAALSNIEPPKFATDEQGERYIVKRIEKIEPFCVPIKEFTEWLGIADPNYAMFNKAVDRLMGKDLIEIIQPDGSWKKFRWIQDVEYIPKTGTVVINLSPSLSPYILNLEKNFTTIKLSILLSLKSRYSIRLYQLIKKWAKIGSWHVSVEDLKKVLGVQKLKQYGHFKNRALNPAVNEINELLESEFNIEFEEVKKVRKVTSLKFAIKNKSVVKKKKTNKNQNDDERKNDTYGSELLNKYRYDDYCVYDKATNEKVYLDDSERVQLILLNRKKSNLIEGEDKLFKLLERELVKVVNNPNFNISEETHFIFEYVKRAKGINYPLSFILSQTKKLVERLLKDENVTYKNVFNVKDTYSKIELLPDWYFDGEKSARKNASEKLKAKETSEEFEKKNREIQARLKKLRTKTTAV